MFSRAKYNDNLKERDNGSRRSSNDSLTIEISQSPLLPNSSTKPTETQASHLGISDSSDEAIQTIVPRDPSFDQDKSLRQKYLHPNKSKENEKQVLLTRKIESHSNSGEGSQNRSVKQVRPKAQTKGKITKPKRTSCSQCRKRRIRCERVQDVGLSKCLSCQKDVLSCSFTQIITEDDPKPEETQYQDITLFQSESPPKDIAIETQVSRATCGSGQEASPRNFNPEQHHITPDIRRIYSPSSSVNMVVIPDDVQREHVNASPWEQAPSWMKESAHQGRENVEQASEEQDSKETVTNEGHQGISSVSSEFQEKSIDSISSHEEQQEAAVRSTIQKRIQEEMSRSKKSCNACHQRKCSCVVRASGEVKCSGKNCFKTWYDRHFLETHTGIPFRVAMNQAIESLWLCPMCSSKEYRDPKGLHFQFGEDKLSDNEDILQPLKALGDIVRQYVHYVSTSDTRSLHTRSQFLDLVLEQKSSRSQTTFTPRLSLSGVLADLISSHLFRSEPLFDNEKFREKTILHTPIADKMIQDWRRREMESTSFKARFENRHRRIVGQLSAVMSTLVGEDDAVNELHQDIAKVVNDLGVKMQAYSGTFDEIFPRIGASFDPQLHELNDIGFYQEDSSGRPILVTMMPGVRHKFRREDEHWRVCVRAKVVLMERSSPGTSNDSQQETLSEQTRDTTSTVPTKRKVHCLTQG